MRYAIVSLRDTAPAWVAAALPPGWRIVGGVLHDLAVLIESPTDDAPVPANAHEIDPATAAVLRNRPDPN